MVRNARDQRQVAAGKKEERWRNHRKKESMRFCLGDDRGRYILQWILQVLCRTDEEIAVGSAETHVAIGKRSVGLKIREAIKAIDPLKLAAMEEEYAVTPESHGGQEETDGDLT